MWKIPVFLYAQDVSSALPGKGPVLVAAGCEIPSISTVCTQAKRRCAQVIHMFVHRQQGSSPCSAPPEDGSVRVIHRRAADPRTVTGCGLRVLGLAEAPTSGVLRICVRIAYLCTYLRRSCRQTFVSFEHLEEYLDERVRKTTDYVYST
jgi:hypothetical protein